MNDQGFTERLKVFMEQETRSCPIGHVMLGFGV